MSVICAETNTSLSTASGFTRVLANNLGTFSATELSLSSTRIISFTPSNAENMNGVVLWVSSSATVANMKSVVVTLKEGVTTRATQTISAATICNSTTNANGVWGIYFNGGTFPYAVTTAPATWTIEVSSSGAQSTHFSLRTSDGTNPAFAAVGSTAVTYTDNADSIIGVGRVTIDQNFTLKGVAVTGDATRSVSYIGCRSTTPAWDTVAQLIWKFDTAAYTGHFDGLVVLTAHCGFLIGKPIVFTATPAVGDTSATLTSNWTGTTAAYSVFFSDGELQTVTLTNGATTATWSSGLARAQTIYAGVGQPIANVATHNFDRATTGTATISGFSSAYNSVTITGVSRCSIQIFGSVPAVEDAEIQTTAVTGQAHVITTTNTGWANPDTVFVGRQNVKGVGVTTVHTVSSVSTNDITLTANLATNNRIAGGHIIRYNGYGVKMLGSGTSTGVAVMDLGAMSHFFIGGVQNQYYGFRTTSGGQVSQEDAAYRTGYTFSHLSCQGLSGGLASQFINGQPDLEPMNFEHCNTGTMNLVLGTAGGSGNLEINFRECIQLTPGTVNTQTITFTSISASPNFTNCYFENGNNTFVTLTGASGGMNGCKIWGNNIGTGAIRLSTWVNANSGTNYYDNNTVALNFSNVVTGVEKNSVFGSTTANTTDITGTTGMYIDYELNSPTGNLTTSGIQTTSTQTTIPGSILRVTDWNDTANDNRAFLPYGTFQLTGSGQSDTTCRTAGGYALRIAPNTGVSTKLTNWPNRVDERPIPIGNQIGNTMTVSVWIYINNTAYDAGVNVMPKLNIKYDDTTTVTATATATFGSWQQLSKTFTLATSFSSIEVWLSMATDATGTNAYVYIDDMQISYPAGQTGTFNLGGLDLWRRAVPEWPPIATVTPADSLWDSQTSAHQETGSFGELAERTEIKVDDNLAVILSK